MIQEERASQALTYPRLATIVASRIVLNAIFRVAYPLIPFVVLRFNVPERTAAWLVTIQVLAGLTSPGLYGLIFEFAIVASFSLASGINPVARGLVMSGSNLATQTGRAAGSWFGIRLFETTNIVANGAVAGGLTSIGIIVALMAVRPQENDDASTETEAVTIL